MAKKGVDWDFEGRRLSIGNALALCYTYGFKGGRRLRTAVCVMTAESQRWTKAWHVNKDGSVDRGLFQLNSKTFPDVKLAEFNSAVSNTMLAYELYVRRGWQPWAAYNSGAYLKYWPQVAAVWLLGRWRKNIERWAKRDPASTA